MSELVVSESPILTDVAEDITFPPGDLWGQLVLLGEEQERQRTEQERQRAQQADQENARLREQLRALGIEPETL